MSPRHLSCPACRIRVRANALEIAVLKDRCPLCGGTLGPVSSAQGVMGLRSFRRDSPSEQESGDQPSVPGNPADFVSRRAAALARDDVDAHRWSDDGGSIASEAAAQWPAAR
jgi:hypothetical protein